MWRKKGEKDTQPKLETTVYGEIGSKVEGSKFYRSYCGICSEPIRIYKHGVVNAKQGLLSCCDTCSGLADRQTKDDLVESIISSSVRSKAKADQY